jgi:hypothetical protein
MRSLLLVLALLLVARAASATTKDRATLSVPPALNPQALKLPDKPTRDRATLPYPTTASTSAPANPYQSELK